MLLFVKAQAASLAASGVDFLVTFLAVDLLGWWYVTGTVTGTIVGGILNFALGRTWIFQATDKTITIQAMKYLMVWNGSLILNAAGVFALTQYTGTNYLFSKLIISILVGIFFNYIIQKKYVFR